MSDQIDPIEIAGRAACSYKLRPCPGPICTECWGIGRAVIAALEEAGYDLVKREKKTIVYTDCVLFGPPLDLPTFTPPAEERK